MLNSIKEQMKEEAIVRMELLHIHPNCIDDFKQADFVGIVSSNDGLRRTW